MQASARGAAWTPCGYAALLVALCTMLLANADQEPGAHICIHDRISKMQARSSHATGHPAVAEVREHGGGPLRRLYDVFFTRSNAEDSWTPLRISVFSPDLDDPSKYCTKMGQRIIDMNGVSLTCTEADVLTPQKRETLLNALLPAAVKLHSERLSIKSLNRSIVVPPLYSKPCNWFTVPQVHHTSGVGETDFVLYVRATPING
ncbi:MAG: leishmanolysin-related zinc metalloendopeptidase, partial [Providencia heimbachae]|nr:leishmanolysin-related zinc metalloendopeptidase [Providencia heimbachae]